MIEKKFRLTLDFTAVVEDFTDQACVNDLRRYSNFKELLKAEERPEFQEFQQRLYNSVLANPTLLNELLRSILVEEIEAELGGPLHRGYDIPAEEEKRFAPALAALSESDKARWQEIIEDELFPENSEHVANRFEVSLTRAIVTDLDSGETTEAHL